MYSLSGFRPKIKLTATVILFMMMIYLLEESRPSLDVSTVVKQNFSSEYELNWKIFEYYNRSSWWDDLLCNNKSNNTISNDNLSGFLALKTFNKDLRSHEQPSRNIFLIETNCETSIPFYVLCGAESLAKQNPNSTVVLLTVVPFLHDPSFNIRNLLDRQPNIKIALADLDNILKDTPLDSYRSLNMWNSPPEFLKAHVSDALRMALLWKEGGTYSDSDIVYMKSLPAADNALISPADHYPENCFLKFKKNHGYLREVMNFIRTSYEGWNYISAGPNAISAGLSFYCPEETFLNVTCGDIHLLPKSLFTPLQWYDAKNFLNSKFNMTLSQIMKSSSGIHTTHSVLASALNNPDTDNLYGKITKKFCPISHALKQLKKM